MLPGKKYLPEDYLRIVWARKWFLIVPTVVIASAVAVYGYFLPNRYRATSLVQVVGQLVPEDMVASTVTDPVGERLRAIQQQILTRTRLERIIDEFGLYTRERDTEIMEDIIERMRTRDLQITINTPRGRRADANSFNVSFTAEDPRTALRVADRLAGLFVQENTENRGRQAESTSQFMQGMLEDARRQLQQHEERLADFQRLHAGRLPMQMQSNLQMLETVQAQIQANMDAAAKERDRLVALDIQVADLSTGGTGVADLPPMAQELAKARANLEGLRRRRTEEHPDVAAAKRLVAELEAKAEEEALSAPVGSDATTVAPSGNSISSRLASLRAEMQELRGSQERRKQEDARLRRELANYRARLEATPAVEAELAELTRDYTTLRDAYESRLRDAETARVAENLERLQIGEQFKVIDFARLPERPVSPDRMRMNLLGLAAGLGAGLLLIGLLEYRDTTFKTDSDILISLSLPVLAVIPAMTSKDERWNRRRRQRLMAAAASIVIVLAGAAAVAWRLRLIQDWVR